MMLSAFPRACIARPLYRAATFNAPRLLAKPMVRPLSIARANYGRLPLWHGRGGTSVSVRNGAARTLSSRSTYDEDEASGGYGSVRSQVLVWGILAVNGVVFVAWYMAKNSWQHEQNSKPIAFMFAHFTSSLSNLQAGRYWTLLTACFSHQDLAHFFMNSLGIYWMAPAVVNLLWPGRFMALYMGAGVAACVFSLGWNNIVRQKTNWSLGASGSALAITTFYATLFPRNQFLIMGVIPAPAWACVGGLFAWDLFQSLQANPLSNTDNAGHIGGILTGLAYALVIRRRAFGRFFR